MSTRRKPSRRSTARRTSETACRTPAVRPIAAPSGSNREAAPAWPAAVAPEGSTDVRKPRKALKTSRRDQRALHWSIAPSPATDAAPGSAPRCRHKKTTPRSSGLRRASIPSRIIAPTRESRETNKHQRLLGRLLQQPAKAPGFAGGYLLDRI